MPCGFKHDSPTSGPPVGYFEAGQLDLFPSLYCWNSLRKPNGTITSLSCGVTTFIVLCTGFAKQQMQTRSIFVPAFSVFPSISDTASTTWTGLQRRLRDCNWMMWRLHRARVPRRNESSHFPTELSAVARLLRFDRPGGCLCTPRRCPV